ncbi:hypothetical protein YC2023_019583 [Brassica napus]
MALKHATYNRPSGKSHASMSWRTRRSLQKLGREPGQSGPLMHELRKGIQLKFLNRDVAVDGNVRESRDGQVAGRAPHIVWCPVHSRRPLKTWRTECRSRPVVLITTSGLQGEQPLVNGTM